MFYSRGSNAAIKKLDPLHKLIFHQVEIAGLTKEERWITQKAFLNGKANMCMAIV